MTTSNSSCNDPLLKNDVPLILIGMAGCGKSTVGKALALAMGKAFIDTDKVIMSSYQTGIADLIEQSGEKQFLKIEKECMLKLLEQKDKNAVISTGGSAAYFVADVKMLYPTALFIYLQADWSVIKKRLTNISQRGIIMLKNSLHDEYLHRIALYENTASLTIQCDNKSVNAILNELIAKLQLSYN